MGKVDEFGGDEIWHMANRTCGAQRRDDRPAERARAAGDNDVAAGKIDHDDDPRKFSADMILARSINRRQDLADAGLRISLIGRTQRPARARWETFLSHDVFSSYEQSQTFRHDQNSRAGRGNDGCSMPFGAHPARLVGGKASDGGFGQ